MTAESRGVTPDKIMQIATGHWAAQILQSAVHFAIFDHLDKTPCDAVGLAAAAGISKRGAQALLDGTLGLGLTTLDERGKYHNAPEASAFLVTTRPQFIGFAGISRFDWEDWAGLNAAVRHGTTPREVPSYEEAELSFWEDLVLAIAPMAHPVATAAAERLGIAKRGPFHMLDVGGGSGAYSAIWLSANKQGRATQLDWHNVNHIAEHYVDRFGVLDRFEMRDGNLLEIDFGDNLYDYGIYSHIAHGLSVEQNRDVFKKFRRALKPGGTLVVADFVLDDERRGHPMALMFYANMLHETEGGRTYTEGEYRAWLTENDFREVDIQPLDNSPVTIIYGR